MNKNLQQAQQQIKQLAARIDAMSLRERAIIFLVILAGLFMLANNVVFSSLRQEQQRLDRDVQAKLKELHTMSTQTQEMLVQLAVDPEALARARIAELKQTLSTQEASVANVVRGLVTPRDMPRLVQQILARNRGLQVVRVENLPAEALYGDKQAPGTTTSQDPNATAQVYKHGMRIELRGQYLDMVRYLRALEAMPAKVFWSKVHYAAETYPNSRLTLDIYTIGLNKVWLEV